MNAADTLLHIARGATHSLRHLYRSIAGMPPEFHFPPDQGPTALWEAIPLEETEETRRTHEESTRAAVREAEKVQQTIARLRSEIASPQHHAPDGPHP